MSTAAVGAKTGAPVPQNSTTPSKRVLDIKIEQWIEEFEADLAAALSPVASQRSPSPPPILEGRSVSPLPPSTMGVGVTTPSKVRSVAIMPRTPSTSSSSSSSTMTAPKKAHPLVVKTPQKYHAYSYVDRNLKADGQPNHELRKLFKKPVNTFLEDSPHLKEDTKIIRAEDLRPDVDGVIRVQKRRKIDGTTYEMRYKMHGISLYPVKGHGAHALSGKSIEHHVTEYMKVRHKFPNFSAYMKHQK